MSPVLVHRSFAAAVVALLLTGCAERRIDRPDPAFAPYITAFTAGHVPAQGPVLVRLAEGRTIKADADERLEDLFVLEPPFKGSVRWQDERTLAFIPDLPMAPGTVHRATFRLDRVLDVPPALASFRFGFRTIEQHLSAYLADARSTPDGRALTLTWEVVTTDRAHADLERCFQVTHAGSSVSLTWHHAADGRRHQVTTAALDRGTTSSVVRLAWSGEAVGSKDQGQHDVSMPGEGELNILAWNTRSAGEQQVRVLFSDPLDASQELEGLAGFAGAAAPRLVAEGNQLFISPIQPLRGEHSLFLSGGLRAARGMVLGSDITRAIRFEETRPGVRFVGKGHILPGTDGTKVPFEAVNLSAVNVRVVRIAADNVPQFLQVNDLGGADELARVGRLVVERTIPLLTADAPDPARWNRYWLDLGDLVRTAPGAIYRLELGFGKEHSLYPCGDGTVPMPPSLLAGHTTEEPVDDREYDHYDRWGYYYWYDDEEEMGQGPQQDPCSDAFFSSQRRQARNVLASDIGLLAKRGEDGRLHVVTSDLRTAAAMPGVRVEVLDLQRQVLGDLLTDTRGIAVLETPPHKPFMLMASKGEQRGYLKLEDGSALDVSAFDVEGRMIQAGIQGFIHGERGVWRPGDTLHLTFLLRDPRRSLPKDHPVVLELIDPMGRVTQRHVRLAGVGDQYGFTCTTDHDAPTGVWSAHVQVGDAHFHKSLRIETVKPNRFKIEIDGAERPLIGEGPHPLRSTIRWLHGAPAAHCPVTVSLAMRRAPFQASGTNGFVFEDLGLQLDGEEKVIFSGRTDPEGRLTIPIHLAPTPGAPPAVRLDLLTRASDPGGDVSTDVRELTHHPYPAVVGIAAPPTTGSWDTYHTDTLYAFKVLSVTPDGKPIAGRRLRARVVRLTYERWWHGDDGAANYLSAPGTQVMSDEWIVTDAKGTTTVPVRIDRPLWGRFALRVEDPESGHAAAVTAHFDWPGYAGRSRREDPNGATRLVFHVDKEVHEPGGMAELVIPSPVKGTAIVSVENASQVLSLERIELTAPETRHRIPIKPGMAPQVYAHVTLLQPHQGRSNDLPIRLYGVKPLRVEDPSTHLEPDVDVPAEIRPDEPFTVRIKEKSGRPMNYTLFVVDEGLLDLTRFKTPDPWNHFYAREALGVRTWDLYDHVLGAFGVQADRVLAIGGSDAGGPVDPSRVGRFKPVVHFAGPRSLRAKGQDTHTFTIENYVGSVRIMVVASEGGHAYGHAERTVPVKQPVMLLATLPRVLGPSEEVEMPVTLFTTDPKVKEVDLRVEVEGAIRIVGEPQQRVRSATSGEQVVTFRLATQAATGPATVTVTAQAGVEKARTRITLGVRPSALPAQVHQDVMVDAGATWRGTIEPLGVAGTNGFAVELSTMPVLDLDRHLRYLIDYPHGCLEQLVSKAMAQVHLAALADLPKTAQVAARAGVDGAIARLVRYQSPGGGFASWPGGREADPWSSIQAGHFLVDAERAGHRVPQDQLGSWKYHERRLADRWAPNMNASPEVAERERTIQAYRLWVLAMARNPAPGAMNRLRSTPALGDMPAWLLAAAYAANGRPEVARELIQGRKDTRSAYTETSGTFGSALRDEALIALTLMQLGNTTDANKVVQRIAARLGDGSWLNTQATAFALLAVARSRELSPPSKGLQAQVRIGDDRMSVSTDKPTWRTAATGLANPRSVEVVNQGSGTLHLRISRSGIPAIAQDAPAANGLTMQVRYLDGQGRPVDVSRLPQGTDLAVQVEVVHTGTAPRYDDLALSMIFPAGWEVRNNRIEGLAQPLADSPYTYQDIRDDRILTYFSLARSQRAVFHARVSAAYRGEFQLPAPVCASMYDGTVYARGSAHRVRVTPVGEPVESPIP